MGTSVKMTSERPETKKKVSKKLSYVNPNATNEGVTQFVQGLSTLSQNTLTNIEKTTTKKLEIPEVG